MVVGKGRDYGINLLIQEELEASIGGVAFSINPITNNPNEIIIESSKKGPKVVVSGEEDVERKTILKVANEELTLEEKMIIEALDKIRAMMKVEVDMEWLISQGRLFILQARPITTLKEEENINFISIDDPKVLKYNLKNSLASHARWMEKKAIVREVAIKIILT